MKKLFITSLWAIACLAPENGGGGSMTFKTDPNKSADAVAQDEAASIAAQSSGVNFKTDPAFSEAQLAAKGQPLVGLTGKTVHVHKQNEEGMLAIDAFTGQVIMDADTPEWAKDAGLVVAQLTERHVFYGKRLGDDYAASHQQPDILAFEDLGWLCLVDNGTAEPHEAIVQADAEFRMNVVAEVLGINRDADDATNAEPLGADASGWSMEQYSNQTRSQAELDALEAARIQQFEQDQQAAQG
ncbi:MAG: hypothetical protein EOR11_20115 [Mesorhizobium sp.]|uniref:hypothetical protein n=1 Tax=Mesorhizobium sp. TaxID=1871066 RepID=UPI000FE55240|nr:hypothetical protein [Mesorhizobium sp.]RWP84768.1 MAG: hypothetical protein EOR11_20115 [Mesorhizobium sp.]